MNKNVLFMAVLLGVAGGTFMMSTMDEASKLTKYLPKSIAALFDGTKANLRAVPVENTIQVEEKNQEEISPFTGKTVHNKPNKNVVQKINNSPELIKIEKQLGKMTTSINQLDSENQILQNKFKQMLKENKDLAIKLKQIDTNINTIN